MKRYRIPLVAAAVAALVVVAVALTDHSGAGIGPRGSTVDSASSSFGRILVDRRGRTLYRFSGDKGAGEATGQDMQAFGGGWYVVSPAGNKIEGDDETSAGGRY